MVEKTKQRAGRNRTLCVKEEEIVSLEKQIYGIDQKGMLMSSQKFDG